MGLKMTLTFRIILDQHEDFLSGFGQLVSCLLGRGLSQIHVVVLQYLISHMQPDLKQKLVQILFSKF